MFHGCQIGSNDECDIQCGSGILPVIINIANFSGFDPSKVGKDSGTAGSNLTCAFNKEREIEQCVSGNSNTFKN